MIRLVLLAALLVACSKKQDAGPSCDKVVDHMLDLTKQLLPGHGDQPMGDRKAMIDQCVQRKLPAAERSCLLAAKSLEDLAQCRSKHRAAQPNAQVPAQPPAPEATPPAPEATPPAPEPTPTRPLPTGSAAPGSAAPGSAAPGSAGSW